VVHFVVAAAAADLEAVAVAATYSVVVDDTVVPDGYNPAFGHRLLRRLVMVVVDRVREKAGLDAGQTGTTRVDQDTRCFAYVALLIEDSQYIGHGHHRLRLS